MAFIFSAFADEASPVFSEQVAALKRNGYSHIELRNVGGQKLTELTPSQAREMKQLMDDSGISVWSMGSPIGKMKMADSWQNHLDDCRRVLDLAGIFGATRLRMFTKAGSLTTWQSFWRLSPSGIFSPVTKMKKAFTVTLRPVA